MHILIASDGCIIAPGEDMGTPEDINVPMHMHGFSCMNLMNTCGTAHAFVNNFAN